MGRAKAQITYETQLGGNRSSSYSFSRTSSSMTGGDDENKRRKSSEAGRKPCQVSKKTGRCGRSKEHDSHPEVCGWRRKGVSGSDTCHRTDGYPRTRGIKPPRYTGPVNRRLNNLPYRDGHSPANKGVEGYHPY